MPVDFVFYNSLIQFLQPYNATLVAVSKTKPEEAIRELYNCGQRDFGENYVQELLEKKDKLPGDIRWHFIGHLQSNKVKQIVPFVHLVHSIDRLSLLQEVNKQAARIGRVQPVLLQMHIAREETKFGFDQAEITQLLGEKDLAKFPNIKIKGLMGMASFTDDELILRAEFSQLIQTYQQFHVSHPGMDTLSLGMSGDYKLALSMGSNMVRIGSLLFGKRG